ncbi:hypothetical protein AB0M45_33720 [Nocardia sp. NPDC051787]|uniref:hypothetical protein n=1 Tax=Nocardia sp. NPDC051787 TaxID=3155415 RepID=UPI0034156112
MASTDEPLSQWHEQLFFVLMLLQDLELKGAGFASDYSGDSLVALEREFLQRYTSSEQIAWPTRRTLTEGLAAYLGETLMRAAGGAWAWSTEQDIDGFSVGVPLITADSTLTVEPISPLRLLRDAAEVRDGQRFTAVYDRWSCAADEKKRADPTWKPVKEHTTADRPDPESIPLADWLTRRSGSFQDWADTYAPDTTWDFTPASLASLEELVRRVAPTEEMLFDHVNRDFLGGAVWYLGETMRRGLGGRWNWNLHKRGNRKFPYVEKLGPRGVRTCTPHLVIDAALEKPGYLTYRYELAAEQQ